MNGPKADPERTCWVIKDYQAEFSDPLLLHLAKCLP